MEKRKVITVFICGAEEEEKANRTIASLGDAFRECAETVLLYTETAKETLKQQKLDTLFVTAAAAGETWEADALEQSCRYLESVQDQTDAVLTEQIHPKKQAGEKKAEAGTIVSLQSVQEIQKLPACLHGLILRSDAVSQLENLIGASGWKELELCRVLKRKQTLAFLPSHFFQADLAFSWMNGFRREWLERAWYEQEVAQYEQLLAEDSSLFAQAQVLSNITVCFTANAGKNNKNVLTGEALDAFLDGCAGCLAKISPEFFSAVEGRHPQRRMTQELRAALEELKFKDRKLQSAEELDYLPKVTLELLEYTKDTDAEHALPNQAKKGVLHFDASVDRFLLEHSSFSIQLRKNGTEVPLRWTDRFGGAGFFGRKMGTKAPFAADLPAESLSADTKLEIVLSDGRKEICLPIATAGYQAKLTTYLNQSYWCFDRYMVTLQKAGELTAAVRIQKAGKMQRLRREAALLKEILTAPYGSKKMFAVRTLYWLTAPVYGRKKIWITFDKLYKGGDCGEYFYRYMRSRRSDHITPYYIIREDVPDGKRMQEEGLKPLYYRSWKQRLLYLHASMIFATHSSVHSFCGFSKWEVKFIQDRIKAVNTCIQHGLSVQDLTLDSNRIVNNNKRYYCASKCEMENLASPGYDYGADVLRLTGLARYDGLIDQREKMILITPTWRAYIAMPAVMGSARPYNPEFKNTEYYRIYQALLENEKLQEAARRNGYRIVYLLHPILSAQIGDFHAGKSVEILPATEVNYEKILTQASLMVTDYSGVQFDFAYMRKPVVYFHPPTLPPHFEDGGFSYETQGFGEICTKIDELVEALCGYLDADCRTKPEYKEREDAFFAFSDHENCRRIFEDALEYQNQI